ncbi:c-Myc-binding protein-like [Daphnia carinata]|uniref:c-Myc-binding protein-like n=1 Tax=Daphnia carinata TaxID=120202 RepID=UPI00257D89E7|nr:c-Myc-binding protein-like [Daphnia carinata]
MESKRDEFRRYLEKAGVMDALTKVLVGLYEEPEKPNDALMYLKTHLSVAHPDQAELESMRTELHFARRQAEMLKEENQRLTAELQKYLAVESLSKEEPSEQSAPDQDEQIN